MVGGHAGNCSHGPLTCCGQGGDVSACPGPACAIPDSGWCAPLTPNQSILSTGRGEPPFGSQRRTQAAPGRLREGLRLPYPALLGDLHQRHEFCLFLHSEGRLPLRGEELVKPMALLGSHRHLREGRHLGLRQRGDRRGIARGRRSG